MTDDGAIRLGTRASALARTQSAAVGDRIAAATGRPWHEVLVRTRGDDTSRPLSQPGATGLFVTELRRALLARDVDVIVHSFKDLPSAPAPGIALAAVPARESSADALVSRDGLRLADLPPGAVVGTSSPRRAAALARLRPDLEVRPVRGNVDSRVASVRSGTFDAVVLAVAGLARLGREDEITEILDGLLPAPAQGALAVECRAEDSELREALLALDDTHARFTTAAEREVLVGINAACTTPVGALAELGPDRLELRAELTVDGELRSASVAADRRGLTLRGARALGLRAAGRLLGEGKPVLLVRSEGNDADSDELLRLGVTAVSDPYVQIVPRSASDGGAALDRLRTAQAGDWIVVTSPMTVPTWAASVGESQLAAALADASARGVGAAATGERSADTLRDLGFASVVTPAGENSAAGLVDQLASSPAGRAVFPCSSSALGTLPAGLRKGGWQVDAVPVYDTLPVTECPASVELIEAGEIAAIVLRSPSAVRALVSFVSPPAGLALIAAGATTAAAVGEAGLHCAAVAASPSSADVARAVADVLSRPPTAEVDASPAP